MSGDPRILNRLRRLYSADLMRQVDDGEVSPSDLSLDPFCAVCTGDVGPFDRRPIGKNDALVVVCKGCDEDPPTASRYSRDRR